MTKETDSKNGRVKRIIHEKKRKQYLRPELIIYGHMQKLTEGGGTLDGDVASRRAKP